MILGTDFLKTNGAIINIRTNTVAFPPNQMEAVGNCKKPIVAEARLSLVDHKTPYDQLSATKSKTCMLEPIKNVKMGHRDQASFKARVITDQSIMLKPGTKVLITSGLAPNPYIQEGLYTLEQDNVIHISLKNTDTKDISLQQDVL